MNGRLFIHASNVHQGGGRTLLMAILKSLPINTKLILTIDSRMALSDSVVNEITVKRVKATLVDRITSERWLLDNVEADDLVFCFGNLPPLFKLRGQVLLFVQNRYLIDDVSLNGFSIKTKLRLRIERLWLYNRILNVVEVFVQTPSMKKLMERRVKREVVVNVFPFMKDIERYSRRIKALEVSKIKNYNFLYVASGEPHKNHRQLIEAWCLLAKEGLFPGLKLTLDRADFADLCFWLDRKVEQYQLKVENVGHLPHEKINNLYENTNALIYPSSFEAFGLPLIEARQKGLPVLASELDYVRDVLDPEHSFYPESAVSIARAVKRFMGIEEQVLPLHDANELIAEILMRIQ